jgi:beta-1,4-N-acetylglucosaminyltransferase
MALLLLLAAAAMLAAALLALRTRAYLRQRGRPAPPAGAGGVATMVVLGSGGHTAEMLRLVGGLDRARYTPRVYVAAHSDAMSGRKAVALEQAWVREGASPPAAYAAMKLEARRPAACSPAAFAACRFPLQPPL